MPAPQFRRRMMGVGRRSPRIDEMGIDNIYALCSTVLVRSAYVDLPLVRLVRPADGALQNFNPNQFGYLNWPEIMDWTGGANPNVSILFDQTGQSHDFSQQSIAAQRPTLTLAPGSLVPSLSFDGGDDFASSNSVAFAQNQGAVSLVSVLKHNDNTSLSAISIMKNAAQLVRAGFGLSAGFHKAYGRRLDTDSFLATAGFTFNADWGVEIARFDYANAKLYHHLDAQSEVRDPFQTAGATSNTASTIVTFGALDNAAFSPMKGEMTFLGLFRDLLTDDETNALITELAKLKAG